MTIIPQIKANLPKDYGKIYTTFDTLKNFKIGIVIPTYHRENYLKKTLESLKKVNLKDCILIIMDESNASKEIEGFVTLYDCESSGADICLRNSINNCINTISEKMIAFNSNGWCKYNLNNIIEQKFIDTYVKPDYYNTHIANLKKYAQKKAKNNIIENLITNFNIPNIPIIKIFKKKHGNMFESYKVGFNLLKKMFNCEYLITLDSDTKVLFHDSIQKILKLHIMMVKKNKYTITTGFNTLSHKIIEQYDNYVIKDSIGGVNMVFNSNLWTEINYIFKNVSWDYEIVKYIKKNNGQLISLKKSEIQHIGKIGLWSQPHSYDIGI